MTARGRPKKRGGGLSGGRFHHLLASLRGHHGPQHWWPAETPFEVMVGAVLTQNTAWTNVERAIANLRARRLLDAEAILAVPAEELADAIRPSGYFNIKAQRLRNLCAAYVEEGGHSGLARLDTAALRDRLLAVNGVGPETADDIVLYAFSRPVFVIDAYTRRILSRLGWIGGDEPYDELQGMVESVLTDDVGALNELHALFVAHGKEICRPRPRCEGCPLHTDCPQLGAEPY